MQLEAKVSTHSPSDRPTTPQLKAAAVRHVEPSPPRFVEIIRVDPVYSVITLLMDAGYAALSVLLAHWWIPGALEQDRNIALYSWLFVPVVVAIMSTRGLYRQKLSHGFLDEFEPVETSIAVAALATMAIMLLLVPRFTPGDVIVPYVRPQRDRSEDMGVRGGSHSRGPPASVFPESLVAAEVPCRGACAGRRLRLSCPPAHLPDARGARVRSVARRRAGRSTAK